MWKIQKIAGFKSVVLCISGRLAASELSVLQETVSVEEASNQKVELDLENLRLVDQTVVTYLAACEAAGTRLLNCPAYIREWIEREKSCINRDPEVQ